MAQGLLHGAHPTARAQMIPVGRSPSTRVVGLVLYRDAVYSASWRCADRSFGSRGWASYSRHPPRPWPLRSSIVGLEFL
jgi:hypothetical protein